MKLERPLHTWAAVSPKAIAMMSTDAVAYFAADAQKDIATLAEERDRIERNRDMWKGQVERQAQELERLRMGVSELAEILRSIAGDCQGASVCGEPEMGLEAIFHKATDGLSHVAAIREEAREKIDA